MSKTDAPHDLSRLPAWARHEIERLTADLASAHAKLAAGPDDSNTFAGPYSTPPVPLGLGTIVRFGSLKSLPGTFDAYIEDGTLVVRGSGSSEIAVLPRGGNVVHVRHVR